MSVRLKQERKTREKHFKYCCALSTSVPSSVGCAKMHERVRETCSGAERRVKWHIHKRKRQWECETLTCSRTNLFNFSDEFVCRCISFVLCPIQLHRRMVSETCLSACKCDESMTGGRKKYTPQGSSECTTTEKGRERESKKKKCKCKWILQWNRSNSFVANNLPPILTFSIPSFGSKKRYVTAPVFASTMRTFLLYSSNASASVVFCAMKSNRKNERKERKSMLLAIDSIRQTTVLLDAATDGWRRETQKMWCNTMLRCNPF